MDDRNGSKGSRFQREITAHIDYSRLEALGFH
jgi:hypothetical protein